MGVGRLVVPLAGLPLLWFEQGNALLLSVFLILLIGSKGYMSWAETKGAQIPEPTGAMDKTRNPLPRRFVVPTRAVVVVVAITLVAGTAMVGAAFSDSTSEISAGINKEVEFVEHNIAATRFAYGLSNVEVRKFGASPNLTGTDLASNRDTIDNIRLWDPSVLNRTYEELQEFRPFYGIEDVDVDRYIIDGELTQVMVSARELDEPLVPVRGWVNERFVYTHGFGAVLSPANAVDKDGNPEFLIGDIPPVVLGGAPEIAQPRIYFSDSAERDYLIAATTQDELDFPEVGGGGKPSCSTATRAAAGSASVGSCAEPPLRCGSATSTC